MKKYVIFGWACRVAGGQIYTDNKCRSLMNKGYEVVLFYGDNGVIVLPNILKCKAKRYETLQYLPSFYSRRKVNSILDDMITFLVKKDDDEVFIESNDITYSYWAEMLAEKLKCKHFLFTLEGYFPYNKHNNKEFLWYKLCRGELAGTRLSSLPSLLDGKIDANDERNKFYHAYCTNSVQDVSPAISVNENEYDIIIGYIGRTSKPCFEQIIKGIVPFVDKFQEKKILIFCIGGDDKGVFDRYLGNYENCTAIFTGPIFPIPLTYMKLLTVAVGSSGSIIVAAREHVPAIKYLDDSEVPLGVIGYDIHNLSETHRVYYGSLSQLLDDIIFNDYCGHFEYQHLFDELNNKIVDEYLYQTSLEMQADNNPLQYFDTYDISMIGLKEKIKGRLLSNKWMCKIIEACFFRKVLRK